MTVQLGLESVSTFPRNRCPACPGISVHLRLESVSSLPRNPQQVRKEELSGAIADIKAKMQQYGITVADLEGVSRTPKSKAKADAKYRGPNGELWSGGPGRKPQWVRELIDAGKSIEDWFNHHRLLEPIGYIPPVEAEANYYRQLASQTAMMVA